MSIHDYEVEEDDVAHDFKELMFGSESMDVKNGDSLSPEKIEQKEENVIPPVLPPS